MNRRSASALVGTLAALPAATAAATAASAPAKVLRLAFSGAETGFDPVQISDVYSGPVIANILEAPLTYDYLARPVRLVPLTLQALPEVDAERRSFTLRLQRGIHFADDPAFAGRARELLAADYAYSLKRILRSAAGQSPHLCELEAAGGDGPRGLARAGALKGEPFDYDTPVEGLRAAGPLHVAHPCWPAGAALPATSLVQLRAVAREVVEFYGERIMEHPVGTGPFRLAAWRRSVAHRARAQPGLPRTALRRPARKRRRRAAQAIAAAAARAAAAAARPHRDQHRRGGAAALAGLPARRLRRARRLPYEFVAVPPRPAVSRPTWRNAASRCTARRGPTSSDLLQHGAPAGRRAGARTRWRCAAPSRWRYDVQTRDPTSCCARAWRMPAQSPWSRRSPPATTRRYKSEMSDHDPARARALLDLYGYVDRDGDGWRETPDGRPLVLEIATQPDQFSRQRDELMKKNLDAVGIRVVFKPAQWAENLKAARAGKLMFWRVGSNATITDGRSALSRLYGPDAGQANIARFRLPAFDAVYERLTLLPDGPEREAAFLQAKRLAAAYAPYKAHLHQLVDTLAHRRLLNYRPHPYLGGDFWRYLDLAS
jgi:ABC-type transport system substrate-binding protein